MKALRALLVLVFFTIALSACEVSDPSAGEDRTDKPVGSIERSPGSVDASVYAKRADRQVKRLLPKGWKRVYSSVSVHGSGSLVTSIYRYQRDFPLWRALSALDAKGRKALQRLCDGVLEPEMTDFGIENPRISFLYLHPKATKEEMSSISDGEARFAFVVPLTWGPNPQPRVANKFMCD